MPKGPNSFFIAPDSEFIINGTISSSNDATGLYTSKTVAADANSGSMSSFVIGTPESNTTYQLKIQDSGSNYTGTYIQKTVGTSGSDDTLVWSGEPDRRYIWDLHNPLLKNYTEVLAYSSSSPPANYYWEDSLTNETANNIQGVYFSVVNKEFLYVSRFDNMMPRLYVASRSIKNYEQPWTKEAEITTLSASTLQPFYNISNIDDAKRGLTTAYEPIFSICEHIDGKLKLAVKFNDDIDIYESTDGVSFTLIARNILSRFRGKRFVNHLKIASSGPYLKIAFVVSASGSGKSTIKKWLGTLTSADGGASWDYSDIADSSENGGAGINVLLSNASFGNQNYSYDLCGIADGSGRFILAYSRDFAQEDVGLALQSFINNGYPSAFVAFAVSSGNARLEIKKQLDVHNLDLSAKPYLACSNDWIWLVMGGVKNPVDAGFERRGTSGGATQFAGAALGSQNGKGWNYYLQLNSRENSMFYLRIDADLNVDDWKNLGDDKTTIPVAGNSWFLPTLKSSKTTDSIGSYFFIPASGNLYSCGPYVAFCGIGWPQWNDDLEDLTNSVADLGSFNRFAQYYRFSGWMLRPPYVNLGLNTLAENIIDMVHQFSHQPNGIISVAEFNYIWGKPIEANVNGNSKFKSLWGQRRIGSAFLQLREDGLHFRETSAVATAYQCNFYYYRCPTVADGNHWTMGAGQRVGSSIIAQATDNYNDTDVRYPMFPLGMKVTDTFDAPLSSWIQPKKSKLSSEHTDGCCVQFVFGGIQNGSTSRNSIGIKINSFTKGSQVPSESSPPDACLYEYFLRMSQNSLALYNTSQDAVTSYYREASATLINTLTLGASFGANDFSNAWWEGRLSFHIERESYLNIISIVFSVRLLGTETWQDSTIIQKDIRTQSKDATIATDGYKFLGMQGISFGLFPDSASTVSRQVKFRSVKVCQGSDMMHAQMIIDNSKSIFTPSVNLIRGRMLAPNPAYIGTGQSVSWGGIGGKFGDLFDTKIKSSYNVENTIKVSSPRFEYRTKGDNTANLKASKAQVVYQLPDATRTANSLGNYGLYHTGLAVLNTNVEKIKIEYCDTSDFSSTIYTIGEKSLKLIQGRVRSGLNNKIVVDYDGESSTRNTNDTRYTSNDNSTYYIKFTTGPLADKSYKILKTAGPDMVVDANDTEFNLGAIPATTLQIYADRMVCTYSQFPTYNKYMRVTLTCHLGTTDYIKFGSLTAGICFSLERVPINWQHSVGVAGNVTEFNSRSGVRWGYKEGPSVKTFSGEIIGDVFDDERENIKNIAEQATQFNSYPIAMVFDGDRGAAFDSVGDDSSAKAFIDPSNILYGTINPELDMVNEAWRYDSTNSEWKVVGNLQLTVIEVV